MKKHLDILVVEDTPKNLEVAKQYFSTVPKLNVDYVTCRDEAVEKMNNKNYDGVITSRTISGYKGDITSRDISRCKVDNLKYLQDNGLFIIWDCELKKIPSVINSEDSCSSVLIDKKHLLNKNYKIIEKANKIGSECKCSPCHVFLYLGQSPIKQDGAVREWIKPEIFHNIPKTNPKSWKIALDYLKQRIEFKN
jgi:hypothetical protein